MDAGLFAESSVVADAGRFGWRNVRLQTNATEAVKARFFFVINGIEKKYHNKCAQYHALLYQVVGRCGEVKQGN